MIGGIHRILGNDQERNQKVIPLIMQLTVLLTAMLNVGEQLHLRYPILMR